MRLIFISRISITLHLSIKMYIVGRQAYLTNCYVITILYYFPLNGSWGSFDLGVKVNLNTFCFIIWLDSSNVELISISCFNPIMALENSMLYHVLIVCTPKHYNGIPNQNINLTISYVATSNSTSLLRYFYKTRSYSFNYSWIIYIYADLHIQWRAILTLLSTYRLAFYLKRFVLTFGRLYSPKHIDKKLKV